MLEDLRDDAEYVNEENTAEEIQKTAPPRSTKTQFLGMSPEQRFVIAIMILLSVCILGSFFLLITGSVALPV